MSRDGNLGFVTGTVLMAVLTLCACGGTEDPVEAKDGGAPLECRATEIECGSECADLSYDPDNCGACGLPCNSSEVCSEGACSLTCQTGSTECTRSCVNLRKDLANCGACGKSCAPGEVCSDGTCATSCQSWLKACTGTCVNLLTDRFSCGACENACAEGEVCSNGECAVSCQQGLKKCDGFCENTLTSPTNCGDCSRRCAPGEVCSAGFCALSCQTGLSTCGGLCVNLSTDNGNCGECFNRCASGRLCTSGECKLSCDEGTSECAGTCVDLTTDERHCGQCGNACLPTESCYESKCLLMCPTGLTNCSGACVDTNNDHNNCGQCGKGCPAGQVCDGTGTCALTCSGTTPHACNGGCVDAMTNPHACGVGVCQDCDATTGKGSVCKAGVCACQAGAQPALCGGACVDLETDVAHCGDCTKSCAPGQLCVAGACTCPSPLSICNGACTDPAFDPANCGGCIGAGGVACGAGPHQVAVCVQGACDVTCEVGFQDCDGVDTNGCERPGPDPCANVVFLTSESFSPDFGGVAVADAACQNAAELAGIPGTFMAWLSDATSSPSTRFTHSSHPYVRVDGQLVAANWNNLTSGIIGNPINVTETGAPVSMAKVLTGTNQSGGTHPSANCAGWTSLTGNGGVGNSWQTASDWTLDLSSGLSLCSAIGSQRLYCFQQ